MDVLTGQFVQAGSPAFFLVLVAVLGVAFFVYKKVAPEKLDKLEDAFKAEVADIKARAGASFPKFVAEIEADYAALKAKIDAFRKS